MERRNYKLVIYDNSVEVIDIESNESITAKDGYLAMYFISRLDSNAKVTEIICNMTDRKMAIDAVTTIVYKYKHSVIDKDVIVKAPIFNLNDEKMKQFIDIFMED